MSYLFDASAIFKSIRVGKIEVLPGNYTIELAKYELGNVLWKEYVLKRRVEVEALLELLAVVKKALLTMKVLSIDCSEVDVAKVAGTLGVTFYDASYIFASKRQGVPLVTEDEKLIERAKEYMKVVKLDGI